MWRTIPAAAITLVVLLGLAISARAQSADPTVGVWQNVSPANASGAANLPCGNFGTTSIVVDPDRPSNFYASYNCQGVWKSVDFGQTWTGPIETGSNGARAADCAGSIAIASSGSPAPPILYQTCLRGAGQGFSRSLDDGVSWRFYPVTPAPRQDMGALAVDPYNANHLIMNGHEMNFTAQSFDGGQTWTAVHLEPLMAENGGSAAIWFVNTGDPTTTGKTFLYQNQGNDTCKNGGSGGLWRTTDGGGSWFRVDCAEHNHGTALMYQPDARGVVYVAGIYSRLGQGLLRSADYGASWQHVGSGQNQCCVFGTPNYVYGFFSWACAGCTISPQGQMAPQPGISGWTSASTPANMTIGPAAAAVSSNGANWVIVTANWQGGLWRYVEPASLPTSVPPTVQPIATAAPNQISGLHVAGNQILNTAGQVVHLRGVNKSGSEYMCLGSTQVFDGPTDQASIDAMRAWQVNVVRLPINEDCWLGINGEPQKMTGAAYRGAIVDYVGRLNASGIAVILDLQWVAPSSNVSNGLQPMPDADHAPAFWTSVAETVRGNGSVMFDLFNEPFPDNNADTAAAWTCLRDGGTCPNVAYPAAGMQQLVDVVRATGATNIVMVPGVQFTNVLSQWLAYRPTDPTGNLAASWHSYADQICNNQTCWDQVVKPVMQSVPLIVGELGERDCQGIYIGSLMDWLDQNGGNYLAWAWNTYDCSGFPSLISDYSGTPTGFGAGFRDHLLAAAGLAVPTPAAIPYFNGGRFPFGINVGSSASYRAPDGTVYLPDVSSDAMTVKANPPQGYDMPPYSTTAGQTGRSGCCAAWTINVPNDTYVVTLEAFPTASYPAGEFGQDQTIQGQKVGTCVWSAYPSPSVSPLSGISCPGSGAPGTPTPVAGQPNLVSYTVQVFNQHLSIQVGASFGSGRTTILNSIRVAQANAPSTPTPTSTAVPAPTMTPTPTATPDATATPAADCQVLVQVNGQINSVSRPAAFCTDQP